MIVPVACDGQRLLDEFKWRLPCQANPQIKILAIIEFLVEATDKLKKVAADDDRWRRDWKFLRHQHYGQLDHIRGCLVLLKGCLPTGVVAGCIGRTPTGCRVSLKRLDLTGEFVPVPEIVGIEKRDKLRGRLCHSPVPQHARFATMSMSNNFDPMIEQAIDMLNSSVGRSVIRNN